MYELFRQDYANIDGKYDNISVMTTSHVYHNAIYSLVWQTKITRITTAYRHMYYSTSNVPFPFKLRILLGEFNLKRSSP